MNNEIDKIGISYNKSAECGGGYPLSSTQQGIWLEQMLNPDVPFYNIGMVVQIDGAVDVAIFQNALNYVVDKNDALRLVLCKSVVAAQQQVLPSVDISLTVADFSDDVNGDEQAWRHMRQVFIQPFDLGGGLLFGWQLVRASHSRYYWLHRYHHLITDGYGVQLIGFAVVEAYNRMLEVDSTTTSEPEPSYLGYIAEDQAYLASSRYERSRQFWCERFAELPPPLIQPVRADTSREILPSEQVLWSIERPAYDRIKGFSEKHGFSTAHFMLALFGTYFARVSDLDEIVIGVPVHNRTTPRQKRSFGMFASVIPVRLRVDRSHTFIEIMRAVADELKCCYRHQRFPIADINRSLKLGQAGRKQLFDVTLSFESLGADCLLGTIKPKVIPIHNVYEQMPLAISIQDYHAEDGVVIEFNFNTCFFERDAIEQLKDRVAVMIDALLEEMDCIVDRLPLLNTDERRKVLVDFNTTKVAYPQDKLIHQLFEEQAEQHPDSVAVVFEDQQLSYGELNRRANRLAGYLRKQGVMLGEFVPIVMSRCSDMVVAQLAVLKIGCAYVPIDPEFPLDRQAFIIHDCKAKIILISQNISGGELSVGVQWVDLAQSREAVAHCSSNNFHLQLGAEAAAYVMYTSGSTGVPKGVIIPHRAVNRLAVNNGYAQIEPTDCLGHCSNPAFDASTFEIWGALLNGARVLVISQSVVLESTTFARVLTEQGVTTLFLTTALFNQYVSALTTIFPPLKYLLFGGERSSPNIVKQVLGDDSHHNLIHVYGPTETTTFSTSYPIESIAADANSIPIGRPISNTQIYILDVHRQPVPIGVAGEIYIGGAGVARGYLNRPELTAERFIADPFSADAEARLYKTGDLGCWKADGNIEYLGRNDHQVKIRGFRIELGEIEAQLSRYPQIKEAVVIAREDNPGDKRLVAYLTLATDGHTDSTSAPGIEELRTHLSTVLPEYMVPSAFVMLDTLPLTPNGKLDRKALPAPDQSAVQTQEYEVPQGAVEERLAAIWQDILHLERVGRHDNFFDLGGHSLLAVQAIARIRQTMGRDLALRDLFDYPSLQDLAQRIQLTDSSTLVPIERADRSKTLPLSWAQQRLWFIDQLEGAGAAYHILGALKLQGPLDRSALQATLDSIVVRHEVLRTTFKSIDGTPEQVIAQEASFALQFIDLSVLPQDEREAEVNRHAAEEAQMPFDLNTGPLIRGRLIRFADDDHMLFVAMHHIISDGWSIGVLIREVAALYAAYRQGHSNPLPPLAIQYADYAQWQRSWLVGETLQGQLDYWKQQLAGAPSLLELPTDRPRPPVQSNRGETLQFSVGVATTAALQALGQRYGATLFMTLSAVLSVLLSRYAGQDDVCIGTPIANRIRGELEALIGFFINTLVLRTRIDGNVSFEQLLQQMRDNALDAYAHQDIPFEQVVEALKPQRQAAYTPLFQVMLLLQNMPMQAMQLPDMALQPMPINNSVAKYDLTLYVTETSGELHCVLEYNTDLFDASTVAGIARRYIGLLEAVVADPCSRVDDLSPTNEVINLPPVIVTSDTQENLPLSFHQERMWFVDTFEAGTLYESSPTYHNIPMLLELQVPVDIAVLERALCTIAGRHPMLRTRIFTEHAQGWQCIDDVAALPLDVLDCEGDDLVECALQESGKPFVFGRDRLVRAVLLRHCSGQMVLNITAHHIVADRLSMQHIAHELAEICAADIDGRVLVLPALPVHYIDYMQWQRTLLNTHAQELLFYWRYQLRGRLQAIELPFNRPRPGVHTFTMARYEFALDENLMRRLTALAAAEETPLFDVVYSGFHSLLRHYSGHEEIVVGTGVSGRSQPLLEGAVGPFANLLVLRNYSSSGMTFRELLAQVASTRASALHYQEMQFDQLVLHLNPEKDMSRTALFDTLFNFDSDHCEHFEAGNFKANLLETNVGYGKNDLHLYVHRDGDGFAGKLVYNGDLFDHWYVVQMMRHFVNLLNVMCNDVSQTVDDARLLDEHDERQQIETWNDTDTGYPQHHTVSQMFEQQAERTSERVAVCWNDVTLSYRDLNERANRLAHYLLQRGVTPGSFVALFFERSIDVIVTILAVMKAGAAYVPIDPGYPDERIAHMLLDSGSRHLITTRAQSLLLSALPQIQVTMILTDGEVEEISSQLSSNLPNVVSPDDIVYVIYTSGSTGLPKGALLEHRNVVRLLHNDRMPFSFGVEDVWSMFHSYTFDFSVWEMYGALLYGGRLVIVDDDVRKDPVLFADLLVREGVTVLNQTPPAFYVLAAELLQRPERDLSSLRYVVFGGDSLHPEKLQGFHDAWPKVELINMFGITETCVHVTFKRIGIEEIDCGLSNVGVPIPTTTVYLFDEQQRLVPVGVPGEIYVGGLGVGRGYMSREDLTRARFIENPYRTGERLYRSGDLGKFLANGELVHMGRIDNQIKLRGFRIELGEIEATLLKHSQVQEAIVVAHNDADSSTQLVAYIVCRGEPPLVGPMLRNHLQQSLPEYMFPSAFVILDMLPLTPNGKVDRKALHAPDQSAVQTQQYEAPEGEIEETLAAIWQDILHLERVGRQDNFFDLGGHSLLAVQAIARTRQVMRRDLTLRDLFEYPTIEQLAVPLLLRGNQTRTSNNNPVPLRSNGNLSPLFLVHEVSGDVMHYVPLARQMKIGIPIYGLQVASFNSTDYPQTSVEEMASQYVEAIRRVQPHGPYRLAGWSSGGVIAYEMASQLIGEDESVEFVGMIDTQMPRAVIESIELDDISLFLAYVRSEKLMIDGSDLIELKAERELDFVVDRCKQIGVFPTEVTIEEVQRRIQVMRTLARANSSYCPQPLHIRITLFTSDEFHGSDQSRGWAEIVGERLNLKRIGGTHRSIMRSPCVQILANEIVEVMEEAANKGQQSAESTYNPIISIQCGEAGVLPVFCVPGAGASVTCFLSMAQAIGKHVPIYGLQPRGLDGVMVPHFTVSASARAYIKAIKQNSPSGPYRLIGHSFGGWVVFEMARQLVAAGEEVYPVVMLDTSPPSVRDIKKRQYGHIDTIMELIGILEQSSGQSLDLVATELEPLNEAEQMTRLLQGMIKAGLMHRSSKQHAIRGMLRVFAANLNTSYIPTTPFSGKVVLVSGEKTSAHNYDDQQITFADPIESWQAHVPQLTVVDVLANHMTILDRPHIDMVIQYL
jgi:amino acid adenylation domain-containing protein